MSLGDRKKCEIIIYLNSLMNNIMRNKNFKKNVKKCLVISRYLFLDISIK